jgi:hypothetical protein
MVSFDIQVSELRYKINRANLEITNLRKRMDKKKGRNQLDETEEYDLNRLIDEKQAEIRGMESEIRKRENQKIRESNFVGRGGEEDVEF